MLRDELGGWAASMDRLRLFWYRRIVNFDQSDQRVLTASLKETAQEAGKDLKAWVQGWSDGVRAWFARPWTGGRIAWFAGGCAAIGILWWSWRRKGRGWWLSWRSVRGRGLDPVRGEAGYWLRRLPVSANAREESDGDSLMTVRRELERVRYGPRESWPATAPLWRSARRLSRRRRR